MAKPKVTKEKLAAELSPNAKKIIHVHQQAIKKDEPAVIVRTHAGSSHYTRVEIDGPSEMVHSPNPDSCGARVWIECTCPVRGVIDV